jgi:hypothetical protein
LVGRFLETGTAIGNGSPAGNCPRSRWWACFVWRRRGARGFRAYGAGAVSGRLSCAVLNAEIISRIISSDRMLALAGFRLLRTARS